MQEHWDNIRQKLFEITNCKLSLEEAKELDQKTMMWNKLNHKMSVLQRIEWSVWADEYLQENSPENWQQKKALAEMCIAFYCREIDG